jgi:hypothetical protein
MIGVKRRKCQGNGVFMRRGIGSLLLVILLANCSESILLTLSA